MHKSILLLATFFCIFNLACCQTSEQYEVLEYKDLQYLEKEEVEHDQLQRLSLVVPDTKNNYPLLIWIGGGAWSYGDRNQELDLARKFAAAGIAVASVGHRLSPAIWRDSSLKTGIQHPKHIEDVAASVKWLYDHADKYGYDAKHFFIGGYSSGGHLAALIRVCLKNTV